MTNQPIDRTREEQDKINSLRPGSSLSSCSDNPGPKLLPRMLDNLVDATSRCNMLMEELDARLSYISKPLPESLLHGEQIASNLPPALGIIAIEIAALETLATRLSSIIDRLEI